VRARVSTLLCTLCEAVGAADEAAVGGRFGGILYDIVVGTLGGSGGRILAHIMGRTSGGNRSTPWSRPNVRRSHAFESRRDDRCIKSSIGNPFKSFARFPEIHLRRRGCHRQIGHFRSGAKVTSVGFGEADGSQNAQTFARLAPLGPVIKLYPAVTQKCRPPRSARRPNQLLFSTNRKRSPASLRSAP
jgi:hypothetical protein